MAQWRLGPAPPVPPSYGGTAAVALGLGLFGGFGIGLYALGGLAFGWPASGFAPLTQAHGQVQVLGLAGLLIFGVGSLLLPAFWRAKLDRPAAVPVGGGLVGVGLLAQLVGQPLAQGDVRVVLLALAAILPMIGFGWAGSEIARLRLRRRERPAAWEGLLLIGGGSLVAALVLRAALVLDLTRSGAAASYGPIHDLLIGLELGGFLFAATVGVQLRLLPSLARARPATGWPEWAGVGGLALALVGRVVGVLVGEPSLIALGNWLAVGAAVALFWATGLGRRGISPAVQAPATRLPGRTRLVLRIAWAGLLAGEIGRATGWLTGDAAAHAFTSVYLVPLILVVGFRMLPRVSAYPISNPRLCGTVIWLGVGGGAMRAFGGLLGTLAGAQVAWIGGCVLTAALVVFVGLAWSPWGVPTAAPRSPNAVHLPMAGGV
jgi:hypothetical protein